MSKVHNKNAIKKQFDTTPRPCYHITNSMVQSVELIGEHRNPKIVIGPPTAAVRRQMK